METKQESYNPMQLLKRQMFAMRNGIIADVLRKAGSPFKIIFGLNLPQLSEIAKNTGKDRELALKAWANSTTRESMLIAPMLMPAEDFSEQEARAWIDQITATEVADVLCLKLLRQQPYALALAESLIVHDDSIKRYTGLRLMCNLAPKYPALAAEIGKNELLRGDKAMKGLADILLSYADL